VVEILGISGSPVKNSNTDRLVKLVQDSTGLKSEFIKLFDCKIEPCHVCMWMTLNGEGFFHARTSRRGINTIFDHFRDKPARSGN
jgi:multimeric flavodoxin WrbA